jgi:hypothetical protein
LLNWQYSLNGKDLDQRPVDPPREDADRRPAVAHYRLVPRERHASKGATTPWSQAVTLLIK